MPNNTVKKKFLIPIMLGVCALIYVAFAADSCGFTASPQQQQNNETQLVDAQQYHYQNNGQQVHQYDYSPERDALQQIYDFRMQNVDTWSVIIPTNPNVKPYVCPSKGYPIPYTTQLTNPMRELGAGYQQGWAVTLPQAEPNGLFTGNTAATWVLCIHTLPGGGTETVPVYAGPDPMAFPYPVELKDGAIVDVGTGSSVQIKDLHKGNIKKLDSAPAATATPTR